LIEDIPASIFAQSDLSTLFDRALQYCVGNSSSHDAFAECIRTEFSSSGLLKCAKHVCKACLKQLRKERFVEVGGNRMDECMEEADDEDTEDEENDDACSEDGDVLQLGDPSASPLRVPKTAYLQGLYPGMIPLELRDLRTVELSMVTLYNPITRLQLNCKGMVYKYFHGRANAYTIINDITTVASVLPQLPSLQTFAILRYTNDVCTKELKYRPGVVKRALDWLKANNHLYKDVTIRYPDHWTDFSADTEVEPESLVMDALEEEAVKGE